MTIEEAIKFVKEEYPFPEIYSTARYTNIVTHAAKALSPGDKILDLGAGPCEIPSILSMLGYRCTAYDDFQDEWLTRNDGQKKVFDFAKKMNVEVVVAETKKMPFAKESFDMFMMHDVLEHLHDSPRDLLNDALESVKPEGFFYITVPSLVNIRKRLSVLLGSTNLPDYQTYYWYPGSWRGPVREYTRGDLERMCDYLNLNIIELNGCHHMLERVPNSILPLYKLFTQFFPDLRDSWLLLAQKPKGWQPKRSISEKEFANIMKNTQKQHRKKGNIISH